MPHNRLTRTAVFAAAVALTAGLSACADGDEVEETTVAETTATQTSTTPDAAPTTSTTPTTTPTTETETESESESESPTSTPRGTQNASEGDGLAENVAEAAERFGSLAPASLFEKFDDCTPTGLEVGQVQFFDSQSKAASTTQLLTELRSSRVVEDTGRHVVGWSTLGTTAVITVVDNELGLVMQQLVSSDIVDPEERIEELGLVEDVAETTTAPSRDDAADAEFSNAEERREA